MLISLNYFFFKSRIFIYIIVLKDKDEHTLNTQLAHKHTTILKTGQAMKKRKISKTAGSARGGVMSVMGFGVFVYFYSIDIHCM